MSGRIKLIDNDRARLFRSLSIDQAASLLGVSARTVRDWRRGKYTIPESHFITLVHLSGDSIDSYRVKRLSAFWYTYRAGQIGGAAYIEKYKTLGTQASRTRGGQLSYQKRRHAKDDMFTRNDIYLPSRSVELAEFIGIMIGDGGMGNYQISITLDAITDKQYGLYVTDLVRILFHIEPTVRVRSALGCLVITVSSANLVRFLHETGLPIGNKLRAGLDVPAWIIGDTRYTAACLRGIFDTDGSIFQEVHKRKAKIYAYPRLSLVSASPALRETVQRLLLALGIAAKIRSKRSVTVERFTDIEKYFTIIGSSNPKHLKRWAAFGGVG